MGTELFKTFEGPRQSGKTTRLLERVKAYLELFPSGTAIVICPNIFMAEYLKEEMWDGDDKRVIFTTYGSYSHHTFTTNRNYSAVFIDEADKVLSNLFYQPLLAVTRTTRDRDQYIEGYNDGWKAALKCDIKI